MDFHTASPEEILEGKVTDVYFLRTEQVLKARGLNPVVRAEFHVKRLPESWPWAVALGVDDVVRLARSRGLRVRIRGVGEGTVFRPGQPVMEIEGPYLEFGRYETAFLGLLAQPSGTATRTARVRLAAGPRPVICFGARRVHPALAPALERAAWLAGADGVAAVVSAERLGIPPTGTMPHALILQLGDTVEAARAFHEAVPKDVPRIVLIDTFQDEKFEALRVAEALGPVLAGVRLDTPASRRGDFRAILQEVRWELDLRGFRHVKIFVSGGIGERQILELNDVADAYGVGSHLTAAPPLDVSMDIVEIEGRPVAKRGKASGAKTLWRCPACGDDRVRPLGEPAPRCARCDRPMESLTQLRYDPEADVAEPADPSAIRQWITGQLRSGQFPPGPSETVP